MTKWQNYHEGDEVHSLTLVMSAIKRPKMYTVNGTGGEVIAFLEGYYSAVAKAAPQHEDATHWSEFKNWLRKRLNSEATETFRKIADASHEKESLLHFETFFLDWQKEQSEKIDKIQEIGRKL